MNRNFLGILLAFVLLGGLLVFQSTRQSSALVLNPSDLAKEPPEAKKSRIRVAGKVAKDSIDYRLQPAIELNFIVEDREGGGSGAIPVVYKGLKPDMFEPGRDVLIDGAFSNGKIEASKLLTQCPSKYEPPDPATKRY
jgi:cytochrome c-type biogenesis protein CcmE